MNQKIYISNVQDKLREFVIRDLKGRFTDDEVEELMKVNPPLFLEYVREETTTYWECLALISQPKQIDFEEFKASTNRGDYFRYFVPESKYKLPEEILLCEISAKMYISYFFIEAKHGEGSAYFAALHYISQKGAVAPKKQKKTLEKEPANKKKIDEKQERKRKKLQKNVSSGPKVTQKKSSEKEEDVVNLISSDDEVANEDLLVANEELQYDISANEQLLGGEHFEEAAAGDNSTSIFDTFLMEDTDLGDKVESSGDWVLKYCDNPEVARYFTDCFDYNVVLQEQNSASWIFFSCYYITDNDDPHDVGKVGEITMSFKENDDQLWSKLRSYLKDDDELFSGLKGRITLRVNNVVRFDKALQNLGKIYWGLVDAAYEEKMRAGCIADIN